MRRQAIAKILEQKGLTFFEDNSRMNYGLIGFIKRGDKALVTLHPKCFYVEDKEFAINTSTLALIDSIQEAYAELTRNSVGRILVDKGGVGKDGTLDPVPTINNLPLWTILEEMGFKPLVTFPTGRRRLFNRLTGKQYYKPVTSEDFLVKTIGGKQVAIYSIDIWYTQMEVDGKLVFDGRRFENDELLKLIPTE